MDLTHINPGRDLSARRQRFRGLFEWSFRYVAGRDIFFSYARADSFAYVRNLADAVQARMREKNRDRRWFSGIGRKPHVSYFLDQLSSTADSNLPKVLERHLRWSGMLVLVATRDAVESQYVTGEVARFVPFGRPIVPIDVVDPNSERDRGGVLSSLDSSEPWSTVIKAGVEAEDASNVRMGRPSDTVVDRIEKTLTFALQEQRRQRAVWGTALVVAILLTGAVVLSSLIYSITSERVKQAKAEAVRANEEAELAKAETSRQKKLAAVAQGEAIASGRVSLARRLAADYTVAPDPRSEALERALFMNIESMRRYPTLEAYRSLVNGVKLLPARIGVIEHDPRGPIDSREQGGIRLVAFSGDDQYLATAARGTLKITRIAPQSPRPVALLKEVALRARPSFLQFSPNGEYLMAADGEDLRVWKTERFEELAPKKHAAIIDAISFSSDGTRVSTAAGNVARVWQLDEGLPEVELPAGVAARLVALGPDGRTLATLSGNEMRFSTPGCTSDCRDAAPVGLPQGDLITALTFSPAGDYLFWVTVDDGRFLNAWRLKDRRISFSGGMDTFAVSPDGRYLMRASSVGDRRSISLDDLSGSGPMLVWQLGSRSIMSHAVFSGDGERVALTSLEGNTTQVWDTTSGRLVASLTHTSYDHPGERFNPVAISSDGRLLARGRGSSVEVWSAMDLASGVELNADVRDGNVAVGGGYIAFSNFDQIKVVELETRRERAQLSAPCFMTSLAVSRTGAKVAAGGACGIFVWTTDSGRRTRIEARGALGAMSFSWDERSLVIADDVVRIRELASPGHARFLDAAWRDAGGPYSSVALSPDGAWLASAYGSEIVIRDVASGSIVASLSHPLRDEETNRLVVAFTDTAGHFATADDYVARLWDLRSSPREVARHDLQDEDSGSSNFTLLSPDARVVATIDAFGYEGGRFRNDLGTAHVMRWLPEHILSTICERVSTTISSPDWRKEFGTEPRREPCARIR